jgi:integrase/recombinase XerD
MTQIRLNDISNNRVDYLTKDQINNLLQLAYTTNFRDFLLIKLLWVTGMRISECLTVTLSTINFDKRSIEIKNLKHKGNRTIFFDDVTKGYLQEYVLSNKIKPVNPIFNITRRHAGRIIKKYGRMLGFDIHPHILRHSFATFLYQEGVGLDAVKLLLGHNRYHRQQQMYIHTVTASVKTEYDKVHFD